MNNSNPWNNIPLEDYERHMEHQTVAQSQLLNLLTGKYLKRYNPEEVLFLGLSGGNGLEHIDPEHTKKVYGIDVNQQYLDVAKERYAERINNLMLENADIASSNEIFLKADFVWTGLIFEYIDMEKGLGFIANNSGDNASLILTIQSNNGGQSVSQTGVETIKSIKDLFKIVDQEYLHIATAKAGFKQIGMEENMLPNGKSLVTYEYIKQTM